MLKRGRFIISFKIFIISLIAILSLGIIFHLSSESTSAQDSLHIDEFLVRGTFPKLINGYNDDVWFTDSGFNSIGYIKDDGTFYKYPFSSSDIKPMRMTIGTDNNIWFTQQKDKIGMRTFNGEYKEYPIPTTSGLSYDIISTSNGYIWFTEIFGNKIGRIDSNGNIIEYSVPTTRSYPTGITKDREENIWFTESEANKIGRLSKEGKFTEYDIPTSNSNPQFITLGPDENLWFTELTGNKIGKITNNGIFTEYNIPSTKSINCRRYYKNNSKYRSINQNHRT